MQSEDFYYGEVAESYDDERSRSLIWRKEDEIVEAILTRLRMTDQPLLDVPVGTGRFLSLYEKIGVASIGVDVSDDMLRQARGRIGTGAHLGQGDIRKLPLREASLGLVVCIRFLHLIKRSTGWDAIAELSRVLKDGGVLVIGARLHGADRGPGWMTRFKNHMTRALRILSFSLGRVNSRSHSARWLMRTMRHNGLTTRSQYLVTKYKDGSRYLIFLAEKTGAGSFRVDGPRSIELFGLPGVGKTTLFKSLVDDPTLTFTDGFALMEELSVWECIRRRPIASTGLLLRLAPSWRELARIPARRAVVTALRQLVAQSPRRDTICLFQEGISHEVWRQLIRDDDLSDRLLSRLLPIADLTIFIEAPVETISERLSMKRHPGPINRELIGEHANGPLWGRATASYERVRAGIESKGGRTVVLQNRGDIESGLDKLAAILAAAQEGRFS